MCKRKLRQAMMAVPPPENVPGDLYDELRRLGATHGLAYHHAHVLGCAIDHYEAIIKGVYIRYGIDHSGL